MIPPEFLAAIIENKADDLPRLVLADWLDEHGESVRAEFIRVQCEAATLFEHGPDYRGPYRATDPNKSARMSSLMRREMQLLNSPGVNNWERWQKPIPIGFPCSVLRNGPNESLPIDGEEIGVMFRRGFVADLTCTWQDWLTHATAILQATPLERVRLTTMPALVDNPYDTPLSSEWCSRRWPGIEFELPIGGINRDMVIPWRNRTMAAH